MTHDDERFAFTDRIRGAYHGARALLAIPAHIKREAELYDGYPPDTYQYHPRHGYRSSRQRTVEIVTMVTGFLAGGGTIIANIGADILAQPLINWKHVGIAAGALASTNAASYLAEHGIPKALTPSYWRTRERSQETGGADTETPNEGPSGFSPPSTQWRPD